MNVPFPKLGVVIAMVVVIVMVGWTAMVWPDLASSVVTREAGGRHGRSVVGRGFAMAAMPGVLALVTLLIAGVPRWKWLRHLLRGSMLDPQQGTANPGLWMNVALVVIAIVTLAVHAGLIGLFTGKGFWGLPT